MNSRGYTLVEIVISLLITSVMVGAVFSMALTTKQGNIKTDHRMIAAAAERQLSTQLSGFVTSYWDYCTGTWYTGTTTQIAGPATNSGAGTGSWQWTNVPSQWSGSVCDTCSGNANDPCSSCYALSAGQHTLRSYLPPWFEASPYSARASYTVTASPSSCPTMGRLTTPQVTVNVTWSEP